ncbi:MAG: hypothetical protein KKH08_01580 [Candidatus Omnitrophica bacterium]|nr:hypothetical protein [Candidatus Omnitrophota bacterium]
MLKFKSKGIQKSIVLIQNKADEGLSYCKSTAVKRSSRGIIAFIDDVGFDGNLRENLIKRGIKTAEKFKWQKNS